MDSHIEVAQEDLDRLDNVPDHICESLVDSGLPATFDRFEICFSADSLRTADRDGGRFLLLGETDSGAVAVDLIDGSVWWLQAEISHRSELRSPSYRQFVNSNVRAFVHCVEAYAELLRSSGPDGARLRHIVASTDDEALNNSREGVWRDVVLDWDAGL